VAENSRDDLSIILAGYEDDMIEKLFSYNEGTHQLPLKVLFLQLCNFCKLCPLGGNFQT
jgi:hypothetical protein